jgi:hypothetical protein
MAADILLSDDARTPEDLDGHTIQSLKAPAGSIWSPKKAGKTFLKS